MPMGGFLFRSVVISLLLFFMSLLLLSENFIKNELTGAQLLLSSVEKSKINAALFSVFLTEKLESSLKDKSEVDQKELASFISKTYGNKHFHTYALSENDICLENTVALLELNRYLETFRSVYDVSNMYLTYKAYPCNKVFSSYNNPDFTLTSEFLSKERCLENDSCSKYASSSQLKDNIVLSYLYKSELINPSGFIFSISSPVYYQGNIIGDYSIDIPISSDLYVDGRRALKFELYGSHKKYIVHYPDYPFNDLLLINKKYDIDNLTFFAYKVPYSKFVIDYIWILCVFFFLVTLIQKKLLDLRGNLNTLARVRELSQRDELTRVYNRKIFKNEEFNNKLTSEIFSIIAVDGDGIKSINDNYGHQAGDEAIKYISDKLVEGVRDSDYVIRNGGDEFIVILIGCDYETANQIKTQIQNAIAKGAVDNLNMKVSISCGVVEKAPNESLNDAIGRADKELYKDKKQP